MSGPGSAPQATTAAPEAITTAPHATTAVPVEFPDFGMDTGSLGGGLAQQLEAVRQAGFGQVTLSARDLTDHPAGIAAAVRLVRASGLRVTGLKSLCDFEGLDGHAHAYKIEIAKSLLDMCAQVGARLLLVASSTAPQASADPEHAARDLRKLAMLAVPTRVRIGYEALSWGCHVRDVSAAWDVVFRADAPNLGLVVDAWHALAGGGMALDDIEMLDPDKIFLVQLADLLWQHGGQPPWRVFPGEGGHTPQLAELVTRLAQLGYHGDHAFEVFNDDYRQLPLAVVAERARRAARWLGDDVLHTSAPLPGRMRLRPV